MPKTKAKNTVSVSTTISLSGRDAHGEIDHTIELDPNSIEIGAPPKLDEVKRAVTTVILDQLEITVLAAADAKFPRKRGAHPTGDQLLSFDVADPDGVFGAIAKKALQDRLKVKITNGREVLAAIKAYQKQLDTQA